MKENNLMKTITYHIYVAFTAFALVCFALSPAALAKQPTPTATTTLTPTPTPTPPGEDRGNQNSAAEGV